MTSESFWEDNDLEEKITQVLSDIAYIEPEHHFGRPFLTAYQLAILVKERFPESFERFGHPIGGRGAGVRYSFTSYLARQLSVRLRDNGIPSIEGRFLASLRLKDIEFCDGNVSVFSSLNDSQYDLSMFRFTG